MTMSRSELFHLKAGSWLGSLLDSGRQEVVTPKRALACECKPNKGDSTNGMLRESLKRESLVIEGLPDVGFSLRADRIEVMRARESGESRSPSIDVCARAGENLLLIECKYKAMPETTIVKSIDAFNFSVARKFDASRRFFSKEGANSFVEDYVVLFNADSKDKVVSMFNRLQLETGGASLRQYKIMDTADFRERYGSVVFS